MKVRELIARLQEEDPAAEVMVETTEPQPRHLSTRRLVWDELTVAGKDQKLSHPGTVIVIEARRDWLH